MDSSLDHPPPSQPEEDEDEVENIIHYAFGSMSQMDAVQEEVTLGNGETQIPLVSMSNCNPVVKDDSSTAATQCLDMVLEETVITDTQHHHHHHHSNNNNSSLPLNPESDHMLMILDLDESQDNDLIPVISPVPADMMHKMPMDDDDDDNNCDEKTKTNSPTSFVAQTQSPLSTTLVKIIVPTNSNSDCTSVDMKVPTQEPPDAPEEPLNNNSGEQLDLEDEEEDCSANSTTITNTIPPVDDTCPVKSSVKVPREMKQLQKMVDSSKVLTDFMASTSTAATPVLANKSVRKGGVGRPKKKNVSQEKKSDSHDSPKRQSARALAATEAALKLRRTVDGMSTAEESQETTTLNYDALVDEISMDYSGQYSDNDETNESVASGGTDSHSLVTSMKMPRVKAADGNAAPVIIVPAPKVSEREGVQY